MSSRFLSASRAQLRHGFWPGAGCSDSPAGARTRAKSARASASAARRAAAVVHKSLAGQAAVSIATVTRFMRSAPGARPRRAPRNRGSREGRSSGTPRFRLPDPGHASGRRHACSPGRPQAAQPGRVERPVSCWNYTPGAAIAKGLNDGEIAEHCGVSHTMVAKHRPTLNRSKSIARLAGLAAQADA